MRAGYITAIATALLLTMSASASEPKTNENFGEFLRDFDYDERRAMKIGAMETLRLLQADRAQLVDIRFKEEAAHYTMPVALHIPLNELPDRLNELDPDKVIITMCPIYDRAAIARLYLVLNGYEARYLTDGMLGLMDLLRGDRAREYY
ncbi:rhodanese-like domain-containing protein [Desulfurispira natronophila]|uniref:Rhodanese-related sulfurtransferase n=1 Tax=Desulfurispira natronophila TaxID=682562 RepID=A0A7W8DG40_9BACT|nr:rhodanese-like domain-containing protein [Desulfurispira natronophila]MBB5020823.1 rhodanese-related sulfurtransferase [Desulfurispira natronophila]